MSEPPVPGDHPPRALPALPALPAHEASVLADASGRVVFLHCPLVVWIADAEGQVRELGPAWTAHTGAATTAGLGAGWLAWVHPDDRAPLVAALAEARARAASEEAVGEADVDVRYRLRRADGRYGWLRLRARPERGDAGAPEAWYGWSEDVDREVRALEEADARAALAARATADGLWHWEIGPDRAVHSPRFRELLGYTAAEFGDSRAAFLAIVHPDDRGRLRGAVAAHLEHREPYDVEVRLRHASGAWRWFWLRGQAAWDADGRAVRMAGSASDVSARHAALEALRVREERFRALVEHASDVVGVLDAQGVITYESPAITRLLGYAPEEMVGHEALAFVHPDDRAAMVAELARLVAAPGASARVRYRCRHREGGWRLLDAHAWNLLDLPAVQGIVINARDVTEADLLATALRQSQERLALALEAGQLVIWEHDLATGTLHGGAFPDWTTFLAALHPDDRLRVETAHDEAVARREPLVAEFRVAVPGRGWRAHYTVGRVLIDAAGRPHRIVGVRLDVTDRVALEARVRQGQKMEALGQLAGGVAHDFNNLLTVIGGHLEFVQHELAPEHPARADLDEIARATARAAALVRQLLAFSRRQPQALAPLALGDVLHGAEALLRRSLGVEIVLDVAILAEAVVLADRGQLEQVLLNLAVNARDAMLTARHGSAGAGGTLSIVVDRLSARADPTVDGPPTKAATGARAPTAWARVRVEDTGHGIDEATRAHIFEPFFTTKPVGQGTGLGLATVFGVVQQLGGTVQVESTLGVGTTFTVLLPAYGVDAPGTTAAVGDEQEDGGGPVARGHGTVLLVEDEGAVRATARRVLERGGYDVLEARHGADALLLWRAHRERIDVVVTDVRMPELGGRELVEVLRADRPALPVVLMTGYAGPRDVTLRPHEHLVEKPFTAETLLRAVAAGRRGP